MKKLKLKLLRGKYPKFVYEKYYYKITQNDLRVFFDFSIESSVALREGGKIKPDIRFKPFLIVKNIDQSRFKKIKKEGLDNLVFHLGLMEIPSYWKATCSPEIEIQAGYLNKDQIKWWKDLIINGMGQFFYENKINWRQPDFLKIKSSHRDGFPAGRREAIPVKNSLKDRYLVPVGGGRDSIVTLEDLKKRKKEISCFLVSPTKAARKIVKIAGIRNSVIVGRKIVPALLELNKKGYLNGHTPFTAVLSFLSVFCAVLFNYKHIAFSNEKSSNEGNVKYLGKVINHQRSKSFEFEQKFRDYSQKYLTPGVEYFSFLRPLYDIQIAKLFSKYPEYFPVFLSCNVAYQTTSGTKKPTKKWCGNCPKCLFIFATLYPFVEEKKLIKIFKKNLFEDKTLLPVMEQLIGERGFKPFECIGTKKESLIAFYLSWKKYTGETRVNLPYLLEYFEKKILPRYLNLEKESKKILNSWNNHHNLPKEFEKTLRDAVSNEE